MDEMKGLIWIASYPKSGNTWTRTFLHNLLAIVNEGAGDAWNINELNEVSTSAQGTKHYETLLGKPFAEISKDEVARSRHAVQAQVLDNADGLIFIKTHNALMSDRGHPTVNFNVTSGAIYIVRNPLDVAISYAHHLNVDLDRAIEILGKSGYETGGSEKQVHEVMGSWSEHVQSWVGKPHRAIHFMRYEDMLAAPRKIFSGLARFLRLVASPGQIDLAIERSSFEALRRQEDEVGFRERPEHAERFFRAGKADQWKEQLSVAQVRQIVHDHGEVMARHGYLPRGYEVFASDAAAYRIRRQER